MQIPPKLSGKAGSASGLPSPATSCCHPSTPHLHQVSMVPLGSTFWEKLCLESYLIVDRPVPGFGCELIVLGFEAIVPLQESTKKASQDSTLEG